MGKENQLAVISQSLSRFEVEPQKQIIIGKRLIEGTYNFFNGHQYLELINQRYFNGKGRLSDLQPGSSLKPHAVDRDEGQTRFGRLLSRDYSVNGVGGTAWLSVNRDDFAEVGVTVPQNQKLWALGVGIWPYISVEEKRMYIITAGYVTFASHQGSRDSHGNWDNSPSFLNNVTQYHTISFSFENIPPSDTLLQAVDENISETVKDFVDFGYLKPPANQKTVK